MSIAGNAQFGGTGIVTATTFKGNLEGNVTGDISNATSYPYTSLTGISTDIVGDITPQLGGNLDVNIRILRLEIVLLQELIIH